LLQTKLIKREIHIIEEIDKKLKEEINSETVDTLNTIKRKG